MRVHVRHRIDRLAEQQKSAAVEFIPKASRAVGQSADFARDLWQALAREKAGPHGTAFHNRIHSERTGLLEAEAGPDGTPKTEFVGVGYRHGRNTDLPKVADKVGPDLAARIRKILTEVL
jgi:hypothetical protein